MTCLQGLPLLIGYTDNEDALLMRQEIESGLNSIKYENLLMESAMGDLPTPDTENNDTCPINGEQAMDAVAFYYT